MSKKFGSKRASVYKKFILKRETDYDMFGFNRVLYFLLIQAFN